MFSHECGQLTKICKCSFRPLLYNNFIKLISFVINQRTKVSSIEEFLFPLLTKYSKVYLNLGDCTCFYI
jgi:hypothetical protein